MTLDELVAQLRGAFGTDLRAAILYGSAAAGEHHPKKSDYNVLVLVETITAAALVKASATVRAWVEGDNPPPMVLTINEWHGSADIYPMEYADILDRHRVLFGDLQTDIRVDPANLRLQLEREAMTALLQVRRGALAAGNDAKAQLALLENSVSTVMVVFRAVLRLRGEEPPRDYVELSKRVAAVSEMDGTAFAQVVWHKRGEQQIRPADVPDVLARALSGLGQLVQYLDRYEGGRK
ncbi:MAG TPA: nucleotidyltransferase domain-containing protein [Gemmatimonadaceae bacterium]|nr:nucleotidyltransferase domain-containing protein [Gemmatimonadaceae bacterium]